MLPAKIVFWTSLFIIFYSYIGYGILLWLLLKLRSFFASSRSANLQSADFEPEVTLLIAAFNESSFIVKKIENSLGLDYPEGKLKFLFVADGSSDNTVELIQQYPQIELHYKPERQGKSMAINRVMPFVTTGIVVFSDANTLLNKDAIKQLVKHYADPKVGAVAGEKVVDAGEGAGGIAGAGEGLYWKYESFLKKLDARFYSVVGAAGELFSIRTALFEPVDRSVLLDDFLISMKICKRGYRVMYEPGAFATEAPSFSLKEEQKRKIRISAGGWQSVFMLKELLNIFKYGRLSFQYISHRVLRWVVCPWLLPALFIANWFLLFANDPLYNLFFWAQVAFYAAAFAGWLFTQINIKVKLLYVPYYFVFMNVALYLGFIRFMKKSQTVLWDKAKRSNE
ncbi:MAG: glycosyltransferase family 2 protein [Chitinophagaceae bacterium]|nr:MAG: glycosyltransferase family 2 protein [Chitinophagaceae bacterium]